MARAPLLGGWVMNAHVVQWVLWQLGCDEGITTRQALEAADADELDLDDLRGCLPLSGGRKLWYLA